MDEELEKYESSIKKTHSFNWTPKFEEEFHTQLNKTAFVPIAIKAFEKLEWDFIYREETYAEARRKSYWGGWTEKISVSYEYGKVKVKSKSLGKEIWDNGKNSKRVKLFIYVFQQIEKEFDNDALAKLEEEEVKANNCDNYVIPESLPQPQEHRKPQFRTPFIGGIVSSLIIGFLLAFLSRITYVVLLYEIGIGYLIGLLLGSFARKSNYTEQGNLSFLLIVMIFIIYVSEQYFQYQIALNENKITSIDFFEFLKTQFETSLNLTNIGWTDFKITYLLKPFIIFIIGSLKLSSEITSHQLERVPIEVTNFAYYHLKKGKTKDQVRAELSKMGWKTKQHQNEVLESIAAILEIREMRR